MYERNAIVLNRHFEKLFGYDLKNNLKNNYQSYCKLVDCFEKYTEATESEDKIMQEYDDVANKIKNIQKNQENLYKKSVKLQEERYVIFQNIGEDAQDIKSHFEDLDKSIEENNNKIKESEQEFVNIISNFSEKSEVRTTLGKTRKKVESDYSISLNEAVEIYKNVDKEKLQIVKEFINTNTSDIEKELYEKIRKNGEKEHVPFDNNAIKSAIKLEINIQKKEVEILYNIYEKTGKLFSEIKSNSTKIERHKKQIKDSKCKTDFLIALKEYLVQFLDNERLTAVNGESEHKKQMKDACKNFEEDLVQINNMYELVLREAAGKANKKMYKELYNIEYLKKLEEDAKNFEKEISKLNLLGTIINPNHWRIDGMKKIYQVFHTNCVELYGRNLSEFELEPEEEKIERANKVKPEQKEENEDRNTEKDVSYQKEEIDKKIDMILGFNKSDEDSKDEDNADDDKFDKEFDRDDKWSEDDEQDDEEWDEESEEDDDIWEDEDEEKDISQDEENDDLWDDEDDLDDEEDLWDDEDDLDEDDDSWEDEDEIEDDDSWDDEKDSANKEDYWEDEEDLDDDVTFKKNNVKSKKAGEEKITNQILNNKTKDNQKTPSKSKTRKHGLEEDNEFNFINKIKKIGQNNKKDDKSKGLLGKFIK